MAVSIALACTGNALFVVHVPSGTLRRGMGYVAGGPLVGRLKFACVIVNPVVVMVRHCWSVAFHSSVCT